MNITNKDIISFGKVLITIGEHLRDNPECLTELFTEAKKLTSTDSKFNSISNVDTIDLFKLAKDTSCDTQLFDLIFEYSISDLRLLMKKHHLGSIKSKKKDEIAKHIVEKLRKHSEEDVFKEYSMVTSSDNIGLSDN